MSEEQSLNQPLSEDARNKLIEWSKAFQFDDDEAAFFINLCVARGIALDIGEPEFVESTIWKEWDLLTEQLIIRWGNHLLDKIPHDELENFAG